MNIKRYFSIEEIDEIINAIRDAELNTSGEIRVHIEKFCREEQLDRAAYIFAKLNMHKTKLRNGVLFYLAVEDHKFAVLADSGINQIVPRDTWEKMIDDMTANFKEGKLSSGLAKGLKMTGDLLKLYFPYQKDDKNELSDEISFEENI
jgi:uncharacterized membrane protein